MTPEQLSIYIQTLEDDVQLHVQSLEAQIAYLKDNNTLIEGALKEDMLWGPISCPHFNQKELWYRVKKPKVLTGYVNIYMEENQDCAYYVSGNRKEAEERSTFKNNRIACVKITYEEGQFDD